MWFENGWFFRRSLGVLIYTLVTLSIKLPFFSYIFFNFFLVKVQLIYSVVLISAVQQSDSVIFVYTFFFNVLFRYGLSQDIEYSFLCYTLGPCFLSILNVMVCILSIPDSQSILPAAKPQVCFFVSVLLIGSFVLYFRFRL